MLVCPSCHHEVPLPPAPAARPFDLSDCISSSSMASKQSSPASVLSSSAEQNTIANNAACPCDTSPSPMQSQLNSLCHITPTCHVSKTCHVTPVCRARAPCHVTPYVCGCALSHSQFPPQGQGLQSSTHDAHATLNPCSSSQGCHVGKRCSVYATSAATHHSHNSQPCVLLDFLSGVNSNEVSHHNLDDNVNQCHWSSVPETPLTAPCLSGGCENLLSDDRVLESNKTKVSSPGSCPTSPSTPLSKSNSWPSNNSHFKTKDTLDENSVPGDSCGGNVCSSFGGTASQTLEYTSNHMCPNFLVMQQNSLTGQNASCKYNKCADSTNCNSRVALARQISCPNTNPTAPRISCPCHQQLHLEYCKSEDCVPSEMPCSVPSHCEKVSHFSPNFLTPPTSKSTYPAAHSRNSNDHFRFINSTGGGEVIIENQLSRSNSPELKFTFSFPLKGNLETSSESASPSEQSRSTLSFDRDTLMQTLASLPVIPVTSSSTFASPTSCHSHPTTTTSSFATASGDGVTFQNVSSRTFVHSASPCSSRSSKSTSPISFQPSTISLSSNNHAQVPETRDAQRHHVHSHGRDVKRSSVGELFNVRGTTNHFITSINNFVLTTPVLPAPATAVPEAADTEPRICHPWTSNDDARVLRQARTELEECGWYYGGLTWREAGSVLAGASEGSFLVRDSWSGRCLYALSLQTARGPTSVRIEYESGKFRLESEIAARDGVPQRSSVVALVQAYTQTTNPAHVWVDHSGQTVSAISVKKPLMKNPPTLQHLARLAYNASPVKITLVDSRIPTLLKSYLESYPHTC